MITHEKLEDLRAFWTGKCADRSMPSGADFTSSELLPWRDHLAVFELTLEGFRWTWFGDQLAARYGLRSKPRDLDELDAKTTDMLKQDIARVRGYKAPIFLLKPEIPKPGTEQYSELLLPLSDDDEAVSGLLIAAYPLPKPH